MNQRAALDALLTQLDGAQMAITGAMVSSNAYTASSSSQSYTVTSGTSPRRHPPHRCRCSGVRRQQPGAGHEPAARVTDIAPVVFQHPAVPKPSSRRAKTLTAADIGSFVATVTCTATGVNKNWSLTISRFRDSGGTVLAVGNIAVAGADSTAGPEATSVYGPAVTVPAGGIGVAFTEQASIGVMGLRGGQENGWAGVQTHVSQCQQGFATKAFATTGTSAPMPGWASEKGADGFTAVTFGVGGPIPVLTHTGGMTT